ncbi:MAG: transposase [Opitutaceae bacterium]
MARPLRMESVGGVYHVLSRGNYRSAVFRSDRTKEAFLRCLGEACVRTGWRIHAWCIMSNHYHLAISTPDSNLVDGMHWLLGTFATRFNQFRQERGHVFQGRYKSFIVEANEGLGPLCHYIHLNPVRAGLCDVPTLARYRWTSLRWLSQGSGASAWYDGQPALVHAGGLRRTGAGMRLYLAYLAWLAEDEPARKRLRFESMSKGWIIGTQQFAQAMMEAHRGLATRGLERTSDLQAAREARWAELLAEELIKIGRGTADLASTGKSVEWKLRLACVLRARTTVTNRWLGAQLHLGVRDEVSRKLSTWRRRTAGKETESDGSTTDHIR